MVNGVQVTSERGSMVRRGRHAGAWKNVVLTQDEQFALKRRALLRQAARAFSEKGYHDTSLTDVAKALGVTKSALYYYVDDKQEILFECHKLSHDFGDQAIEYAEKHGRNGREKISLLVRTYLELLTSELGACAVLLEFNALTPANRKIIGRRRDTFEHYFRKLVQTGIADGSLRKVDPKLTVFFFMGAVNWLTRWFDPSGEHSGEHIAKEFAGLLDAAIRSR
ncbi:MAG: TetR/AcrR family transcriptional regulator [Hyphomonadaceae bacterium]|nr:TetR/AcrR family transcriptional regulator [Hyphomonadaceae bacterium]